MRLKGKLARLMVIGGLAVMTAGFSQAGGMCWGESCQSEGGMTQAKEIYIKTLVLLQGAMHALY